MTFITSQAFGTYRALRHHSLDAEMRRHPLGRPASVRQSRKDHTTNYTVPNYNETGSGGITQKKNGTRKKASVTTETTLERTASDNKVICVMTRKRRATLSRTMYYVDNSDPVSCLRSWQQVGPNLPPALLILSVCLHRYGHTILP